MPTGPLGPQGPTVDPNWAWDIPGWTSQGGTVASPTTGPGDTIGANLGSPSQGAMLIEPAALSGYITRSLDPDATTAGTGSKANLTTVSGTAYLAAVQVLEPVLTTKVIYAQTVIGVTTPHLFFGLYNAVTGTLVAQTADQGAGTAAVNAVNWATATAISPGFYWALMLPIGTTVPSVGSYPLSGESQKLLTGTSVVNFTVGTSLRFATGTTGLTGLAALPAALTGTMVAAANANGWFVGLA